MDIYEGYNYRINIVGADSTIIVDSNTGLVKASISDVDENIIVDIHTNTLYGTLVGNIVNQDLELILNSKDKEMYLDSLTARAISGNIYNGNGELLLDSTLGIFYGNVANPVDLFNNSITFGELNNPIDIVFNLDQGLDINVLIKPLGQQQTFITARAQRGSLDIPKDIDSSDIIGLFTCEGFYDGNYRPLGMIGFGVDPDFENTKKDTISSYFIVHPHNGTLTEEQLVDVDMLDTNHYLFQESLTFGRRTLGAPIFKVGSHQGNSSITGEKGMIVFNNETGKFQGYTGDKWVDLH